MGVMDERSSRMFVGVCLLVLLWIGTYWVYDPGAEADAPKISFADTGPEPEPLPLAEPPPGPLPEPVVRQAAPVVVTPAPEPEPEPEPEPAVRVVPPEFREYVIRPGDTLGSIARDQLGDGALWTAIAQANPLKDPRRLRTGEKLRIPVDPTNIQGRVVRAEVDPAQPADPAGAEVEYLVQPGDSLTKIARAYYGSVRHADFIYESNRDVLADKDSLRVGQTLRLPPLGAQPGG